MKREQKVFQQEEMKGVDTFAKFCDYIESKVN